MSYRAHVVSAGLGVVVWCGVALLADRGWLESGVVLDGVYYNREGRASDASGVVVDDSMLEWFNRESSNCFVIGPIKSLSAEERELRRRIDTLSTELRLDSRLVRAIILVESRCRADAVSPRGAVGLMQVLPTTAREMGVPDPERSVRNIDAGIRYLAILRSRFRGSVLFAVAAYNAGPRAVAKYDSIPPYSETQRYASRVLTSYTMLRIGAGSDERSKAVFSE